ncbi:MAG: zinc-binding dehydrogenase [Candidatus Caldarchaeum sp.]|nr:zinc-binding dehydrogenase [Candidatus Caldarchaeum sp.]
MKAVSVRAGGGVEIRETSVPEIREGELLIEMKACGIDGTDLEKAFGKPLTPPMLGHEVVGIVAESSADGFRKGERVFVHHHVSCGACYYCLHGSPTMCPLFLKTSIEPCGFAEFFRVPKTNVERGAVLKLPENIDWLEAVFIEPAACVLRALKRSGFKAGDSISIVGAGPTGAIFIVVAKSLGAGVVAVADLSRYRLAKAVEAGAHAAVDPSTNDFPKTCRDLTDGRGVDIGVLATPAAKPLSMALQSIRKGGTLCFFGAPEKGDKTEVDFSSLFIEEKNIVTTYSTTEAETNTILNLLAMGRFSLKTLITHVYSLEEAETAFQTARDVSKSLKVVLTS